MDELSDEMLKIIDLIKAGEKDLIEQLLKGNSNIFPEQDNDLMLIIFKILWPDGKARINWFDKSEEGFTITRWLLYWSSLKSNF